MSKKPTTEEIAARLEARTELRPMVKTDDLLSTGCTLLNMAFSGTPGGGVPKGGYLYMVGDSGAGKTWFTFNLFAEAARNKQFAGHRFVFDNAENGALMDVGHYFGSSVLERLNPPTTDTDGEPLHSSTVQQFYYHLEMNVREGPCIYVLDSMDALNDDADEKVFEAELHKYETGKGQVPGSMGMAKAKSNSKNINRMVQSLRSNGSILVVISQTRDRIGSHIPGLKTRGGGHALKFYAHLEVWLKVKGPLVRRFHGKDREVGSLIQMDVQKNRVNGWEGKVPLISFLKGYGVDDLGSCVDYLLEEKHWSKIKSKKGDDSFGDEDSGHDLNPSLSAPEFEFEGKKDVLIKNIQERGDEWELQQVVAKVWREILDAAKPDRMPRYR